MNIAIDQLPADLDDAVSLLVRNKLRWARTNNQTRIDILENIRDCLSTVAAEWVRIASAQKQIPDGSPLEGEEWLSGPYAVMVACNALTQTLSEIAGREYLQELPVKPVGRDQIAVRVLPNSIWDHLLFSGIRADVWMMPGVTEANLHVNTAGIYDIPEDDRPGAVSLVLGAGNISAIAPLDCFHKLFSEHSVVLLKMNPVNDYLIPVLEAALAPLIDFGALQIVAGDTDVGEYLCNHPSIENIHITGAGASHDAIVWGSGQEAQANRRKQTPRNKRAITSELGAVCPTIVVPGPWSEADIRFQAEQVATQKLHNSGFNCVACQMLVMPAAWDLRDEFLGQVKVAIENAPDRGLYYPGADTRIRNFADTSPNVEVLRRPESGAHRVLIEYEQNEDALYAEQTEIFAPALGVRNIGGDNAETYLRQAITYCNEQLHGTLGANIIVHPHTRRELAAEWDKLISDLRYGCIAVNAWTGLGFLAVQAPWGAFPGHTLDDVQSGIGFVHNTYMFDRVERTVVEAPFRPFPRNLLHGSMTLLPKPPWFVTNTKAHILGRLLTEFQYRPGFLKLPRIFLNALLG